MISVKVNLQGLHHSIVLGKFAGAPSGSFMSRQFISWAQIKILWVSSFTQYMSSGVPYFRIFHFGAQWSFSSIRGLPPLPGPWSTCCCTGDFFWSTSHQALLCRRFSAFCLELVEHLSLLVKRTSGLSRELALKTSPQSCAMPESPILVLSVPSPNKVVSSLSTRRLRSSELVKERMVTKISENCLKKEEGITKLGC